MAIIPSATVSGRVLSPATWRKDEALSDHAEALPAPASEPSRGPASPPGGGEPSARPSRVPSPVEATAALLRGRFTALVIWRLFWGGKRFYQLVRELEGVPRKAVAHELEELERAGIVKRTAGRGAAKVEYQLTPQGEGLKIVVGAMYEWGLRFRPPAPSPEQASH